MMLNIWQVKALIQISWFTEHGNMIARAVHGDLCTHIFLFLPETLVFSHP